VATAEAGNYTKSTIKKYVFEEEQLKASYTGDE
jgi:hypothetical protein